MKKKSSFYFLVPLLFLILFGAYYWNFTAGYEQKQEARAAQIKKQHDDKVAEDNRLRLKAVNDALASQAKRKAEREAKAAKEKQETEELQNLLLARDHADYQSGQLREKYDRLVREIQNEKTVVEKNEKDREVDVGNLDFLQIQATKAQSNVESLTIVLNQITAADAAYAAAASAAAAAAAKKE